MTGDGSLRNPFYSISYNGMNMNYKCYKIKNHLENYVKRRYLTIVGVVIILE